jgi:hypothetical protein
MSNYPSSDPSFTTKQDGPGNTVQAAHMNAVQDEIVAIGSALRGTLQHDLTLASGKSLNIGGNSTITGSVVFSSLITATAQPRSFAHNSTSAQSLTATVWAPLTLGVEVFDIGALHSTSAASQRFTIPVGSSGLYHLIAQVAATAPTGGSTGYFALAITKNTNSSYASSGALALATAPGFVPSITNVLQCQAYAVLDAGDYVEAFANQNSSATVVAGSTVTGSADLGLKNWFQAVRIW